uniref:Uncharacterized protein n=1 Tax=Romanomermis culicivorax TaxID=13658 RepID=A0A915K118_ROMCU
MTHFLQCFIVLPTTTNDPKIRQFDRNFYFDPELSSFVFDLYNFYRRQAFHGLIDNQPQAKLMPYVS